MLGDTMLLDSYKLALVDIREARLDALHARSISVRWPHRAEDWEILRKPGRPHSIAQTPRRLLPQVSRTLHEDDRSPEHTYAVALSPLEALQGHPDRLVLRPGTQIGCVAKADGTLPRRAADEISARGFTQAAW